MVVVARVIIKPNLTHGSQASNLLKSSETNIWLTHGLMLVIS